MADTPFPATQAWFNALPAAKLEAFPSCQAHTRLPRMVEAAYPTLATLAGLPLAWRRALHEDAFRTDWVPEARLVLQYLLLRDAFFADDASFLAAAKERIKTSFMAPAMRPMMAVVSPHLLILGASSRWSQYHRGTQLHVSSKGMHTLQGTLSFPPGLYPELMVDDTRIALQASIEATGKVAHVSADMREPGLCVLQGGWQ